MTEAMQIPISEIDFDALPSCDEYLAHAGIKGMHWGQRKYQNEDGTWTAAGKARRRKTEGAFAKKAGKLIGKVKKKMQAKSAARKILRQKKREEKEERKRNTTNTKIDPKKMTDQELDAAIRRLTNEQRYTQLTGQDKKGQFRKKLATAAGDILIDTAKSGARYLVDKALTKAKERGEERRAERKRDKEQREEAETLREYNNFENNNGDVRTLTLGKLSRYNAIKEARGKLTKDEDFDLSDFWKRQETGDYSDIKSLKDLTNLVKAANSYKVLRSQTKGSNESQESSEKEPDKPSSNYDGESKAPSSHSSELNRPYGYLLGGRTGQSGEGNLTAGSATSKAWRRAQAEVERRNAAAEQQRKQDRELAKERVWAERRAKKVARAYVAGGKTGRTGVRLEMARASGPYGYLPGYSVKRAESKPASSTTSAPRLTLNPTVGRENYGARAAANLEKMKKEVRRKFGRRR